MAKTKTVLVIGAGPKGTAIAARACAHAAIYGAHSTPQVIVLEKTDIANNWTGIHGYTNGMQLLGTSPDKDIGFPYRPDPVSQFIWLNYSWRAYMIAHDIYGDWIDRGSPSPTHADWADYLKWVWSKIRALTNGPARIVIGEVRDGNIHSQPPKWVVNCAGISPIICDGLVFTGPGGAKGVGSAAKHSRWLTGSSLWAQPNLAATLSKLQSIGIIGAAETAASAAIALVRDYKFSGEIILLTRRAMIYSRGESYFENRIYTDPDNTPIPWRDMDVATRLEFIERTDRSVISVHAMESLKSLPNLVIKHGEFVSWTSRGGEIILTIKVKFLDPSGQAVETDVDIPVEMAINAMGFDSWGFINFLEPRIRNILAPLSTVSLSKNNALLSIGPDLSLPHTLAGRGLHVPMLAHVACGPGFPNLSCLGLMAECVLSAY